MSAVPAPDHGTVVIRTLRAVGALVAYGALITFLYVIGLQIYRWFRDGEWTHFGVAEALRVSLSRCCVKDGDTGRLASLLHWLEAPVDWLGLHKVFELVPASLALFAVSILGNSLLVYCKDRLDAPSSGDASS